MRFVLKRKRKNMQSSSKTIFITSFHVLVSRNILASPFFDLLKKDGWKIVVVMPEKKREYFEREFGGENVFIEGVKNTLGRADDFFKDIALAAIRTRSLAEMRCRGMGMERPLSQKLFFFAPVIRSFIPLLYKVLASRNAFRDLFNKHKPSVVFSTDVFSSNDCRIMNEARHLGIPTVGMVRSWDNLTTKGGFRVVPDKLVVHGKIQRDEAVRFHGISLEIIDVVGVPHYDSYLTPSENFDKVSIGVPSGKPFIVFAPLGDRIMKVGDRVQKHRYDEEMIAILDRIIPADYFLVVRFPPTDTVTVDRVRLSPRVVFQEPGVRFGEGVKGVRASEMGKEDDKVLQKTLRGASVLVNPFSSLCIDAVVLDRPVIIPTFVPSSAGDLKGVLGVQGFNHLERVFQGGCQVARNETELRNAIISYCNNPSSDKEERRRFAEDECYCLDGKASARLLGVISSVIKTP